jgi:hypothetical protein
MVWRGRAAPSTLLRRMRPGAVGGLVSLMRERLPGGGTMPWNVLTTGSGRRLDTEPSRDIGAPGDDARPDGMLGAEPGSELSRAYLPVSRHDIGPVSRFIGVSRRAIW